ncbi:hypothetical protein [Pseudonocardia sp. TRM90224]|uniref:hypothetical protein n=1 Tax=Pseudonocardia sp. TRM90224 TaxID=2812678 RepID=UPI001E28E063|nr:hypothetical protein [Pseudonocardia sp. TRM90224]
MLGAHRFAFLGLAVATLGVLIAGTAYATQSQSHPEPDALTSFDELAGLPCNTGTDDEGVVVIDIAPPEWGSGIRLTCWTEDTVEAPRVPEPPRPEPEPTRPPRTTIDGGGPDPDPEPTTKPTKPTKTTKPAPTEDPEPTTTSATGA